MIIRTELEMLEFGAQLAVTLGVGDWVAIDGPLGAGKTVLSKGILAALGYAGEVTSPSYALVHNYEPPELSVAVAHADLYRLEDAEELHELGLAEEQDERITLVEWAERAPGYGHPTHHIIITPQGDGSRIVDYKTGTNDSSD